MSQDNIEKEDQEDVYTPLSTEYNFVHSRMWEEFPEGSYGSSIPEIGPKSSGWDTGEEANPRFSYENEQLHEATQRLDPQADPIRLSPEGEIE